MNVIVVDEPASVVVSDTPGNVSLAAEVARVVLPAAGVAVIAAAITPADLGGGAAATLGTIGGAGPTAAAQARWLRLEVDGVPYWIAAWT